MSGRTDLKVGFACNNRCVFCAQGEKRRELGSFPKPELIARMRGAFQPGQGLVLTGGEPTVHRHLLALVAEARRIGYEPIQVQTNGRMLAYRATVRRLVEAGATEISPALHGPSPSVHDALTRAPGSFEETVQGIRNALDVGAVVITNTVVVQLNVPVLVETVQLLADLGVRQMQLALVHPVGTAAGPAAVVPHPEVAGAAIRAAVRAGRARGVRVVTEAVPLCLLRGVRDAAVEAEIPETTVVDADGAPFAFSDWRRGEGKAKGPSCSRCAFESSCEGPWREYPQRFGWDAFVPLESIADPV